MHDTPQLETERYRILHEVGEGTVATVWHAEDLESSRPVAIKVMRPEQVDLEDVQRLAQEVEILRKLHHPCIVRPYGTGVTRGGAPYVVMEWVEGMDLRARLTEEQQLAPVDVANIVSQTGAALNEAHAAEVIHRDLKPENVLLCAPEHLAVKLVDFGMAKILAPDAASLTTDDKLFGTPAYMAPERARGQEVGAAADVYAMAVMTFEMIEGRRPFDGVNPIAVLRNQISQPPPPMTRCSAQVQRVVHAGMAKDPAERPGALELARELDRLLEGGGG